MLSNGTSTLELFPNNLDSTTSKFKTFPAEFMLDVQEGNLPQFTFIDYNGSTQSMEPPQNVVLGDELMYDVVTALMSSSKWNKTLLIINFDEHGGLYDHVHPVPAIPPDDVIPIIPSSDTGYYQYDQFRRTGFRVPLIMVSPYAKKDHVSHVVHEQTSILSLLEHKFNLPALSCRDANANNLFDLIDFEALRSQTPNFPDITSAKLTPPSTNAKFLACTKESAGIIPSPGSVISASANVTGPNFAPKCGGDCC